MGGRNTVLAPLAGDAATVPLCANGGGRWCAPMAVLLAGPTVLALPTPQQQRARRACR
jgi:hypothetical protein